jgi:hypothetical protein
MQAAIPDSDHEIRIADVHGVRTSKRLRAGSWPACCSTAG